MVGNGFDSMIREPKSIVIVGAGQAGGWAAKTLRAEGYGGTITLLGDEPHPPYERPPLSKAVLAGEAEPRNTYLFEDDLFDSLDFLCGESATRIQRQQNIVQCASGRELTYDRLLLATGGRARPVAVQGLDAADILLLRTLEDAAAIKSRFEAAATVALIGGGWIGLEVAATARKAGLEVHLFELADCLCGRAAPPLLSDYLLDLHTRRGIDLHLSTVIKSAEKLSDGRYRLMVDSQAPFEVDAIVAGVGLIPNDRLARDAGLVVDNGIVTDALGVTSDPAIFAAGDVANSLRPASGQRVRYESWENAQNQGIAVAKAMLGQAPEPYDTPWFWSDQHDANIQIVGTPDQSMTCTVRGEPASDSFSAFYLRDGSIRAAVSVNQPRDLTVAKRLIAQAIPVTADELADPLVPLKKLLKKTPN